MKKCTKKAIVALSFIMFSATQAGLFSPFFKIFRGTFFASYFSNDNFRVVVPGRLYRSNTLPPKLLAKYITQFRIKTVVNLRGAHPDKKWWQREAAVIAKHGIAFYNIPMTAHEYPTPSQLNQLLSIYQNAQGPLLIHCMKGVDRTGTACALWLMLKENTPVRKASEQLSFFSVGHTGWRFGNPMKKFLGLYDTIRKNKKTQQEAVNEYAKAYVRSALHAAGKKGLKKQPMILRFYTTLFSPLRKIFSHKKKHKHAN